jgi:hypothetical protein
MSIMSQKRMLWLGIFGTPFIALGTLSTHEVAGLRIFFIVFGLLYFSFTILAASLKISVIDQRLIVRQAWISKSVTLVGLVSVWAKPYKGHSELVLIDSFGKKVQFSLTGFAKSDQRKLMELIRPYVMADHVERRGSVDLALDAKLWKSY